MAITTTTALRFREFRERAGLTHEQVAKSLGVSSSCIWDIESHENELSSCYSPNEVQTYCKVLGVHSIELFGIEILGPPISAGTLVRLIHEQCCQRNITLEQFGDIIGWNLNACIEPPARLLEDISIDGLQWLCRELNVDWHRVIIDL